MCFPFTFLWCFVYNSDAVSDLQTHDEYSQNELDVIIVSLTR